MTIKTFTVARFSNGLNTFDPVTILKPGFFSDCGNVSIFGDGVGSRMGRALQRDTGIASPIHSLSYFLKLSTGTLFVIEAQSTNVYANGIQIDTTRSGAPLSFAVLNDTLYYTDGVNNIREWTGAGMAADLAGAPVALSISEFKGCIVACGISGAKNVVRWSSVNTPGTWPTENQIVLNDDDPAGNIGVSPYFNQLAVFKKTKLYLLDGFPTLTNVMKLPTNIGCVGRRTIVVTPNGPLWLFLDGIYGLIEGEARKISQRIDSIITAINPTRYGYANAAFHKNSYLLSFASGSNTYENYIAQLDFSRNGWTLWPEVNVSSQAICFDADGLEYLLQGTKDGKTMKAFSGLLDDTAGYRSNITLSPFIFPRESSLLEMVLYVELFSSHGIDVAYSMDSGAYASPTINLPHPDPDVAVYDVSKFDESYYGSGTVYRIPKRIGGKGRQVEFTIFTSGPSQAWKLHKFELNVKLGAR